MPTWTESLRRFIAQADEAGVLVMVATLEGQTLYTDAFRLLTNN
jgi:hypothetical protein